MRTFIHTIFSPWLRFFVQRRRNVSVKSLLAGVVLCLHSDSLPTHDFRLTEGNSLAFPQQVSSSRLHRPMLIASRTGESRYEEKCMCATAVWTSNFCPFFHIGLLTYLRLKVIERLKVFQPALKGNEGVVRALPG